MMKKCEKKGVHFAFLQVLLDRSLGNGAMTWMGRDGSNECGLLLNTRHSSISLKSGAPTQYSEILSWPERKVG